MNVSEEADDCCVICKLQKFNRRVSCGAVVGGGGGGGAICDIPKPHLLLPVCQEVFYLLTGGGWHSELGKF